MASHWFGKDLLKTYIFFMIIFALKMLLLLYLSCIVESKILSYLILFFSIIAQMGFLYLLYVVVLLFCKNICQKYNSNHDNDRNKKTFQPNNEVFFK